MDERGRNGPGAPPTDPPKFFVGNSGEPIRLAGIKTIGVAASSARKGEKVQICTRLAITSDERDFHRVAEGLIALLEGHLQQAGASVPLRRAHTILVVIHEDESAELWVDTAAVSLMVMAKRAFAAGSAVFESDIGDITGMDFPAVALEPTDKVVCLFRLNFRFALYFDFNPDGNLSRDDLIRQWGSLHRNIRYRHLYDAISNTEIFDSLVRSGWFPFVEILGPDFNELLEHCSAGWSLEEAEDNVLSRFDGERLQKMYDRWVAKPYLTSKGPILKAAIEAFEASQPIAAIKIAVTEIEGVLLAAYRAEHGRGARIKKLLQFAAESAERKAGSSHTLLFPRVFAEYLSKYTFAKFDPTEGTGAAGSRHAVGHGAADAATYTQARALQALLTLDQLVFYT
jgi:hypothetical protein